MLSCVIIAKDEEDNLKELLPSLSFCDEIIVIDDDSTDNTVKVTKSYKARVLKKSLNNDFAGLRNYGLKQAVGEWILFVDADERLSKELIAEIRENVKKNDQISAYYIKRRDFFWGREVQWGEVYSASHTGIIRLVKKNKGKWQGSVHEQFVTNAPVSKLKHSLAHYPHRNISDFLKSINKFSSIRARQKAIAGQSTGITQIIFLPMFKFIYTFFIKLGFLDGARGFVYSFMMSFHSFLYRSKLFFLLRDKKV